MGIEFDPINKYIKITSPTTELMALEIYSAAMDYCDEQTTMGYDVPMKAVGKFDMGGGVYSDSIFMLINGWKIKFWSGTYQAVITGTLLPEPGESRTVPPDSGNVEVIFQVASQATVIPDEAEWTQTEKDTIMSDVDAIEAKTEKLPSDPASESRVITIQDKTQNLPTDPASESKLNTVSLNLEEHDAKIKGNPNAVAWEEAEASLMDIKHFIEELAKAKAEVSIKPKSIAQQLHQEQQ